MRPLGGRLDESEMLGSTPYTYYGGKDSAPAHPGTRCPTTKPLRFWGLRTQGPQGGMRAVLATGDPSLPSVHAEHTQS